MTLNQVRSCDADGYLVRNYDHLKFFANDRRVGDFSLNIANRLTAEYFKTSLGWSVSRRSYDLNFQQLEGLLWRRAAGMVRGKRSTSTCRCFTWSTASSALSCRTARTTRIGGGLDVLNVSLRDRVGAEHPVKADVGCRTRCSTRWRRPARRIRIEDARRWGCAISASSFLNETPGASDTDDYEISPIAARRISGAQIVARVEAAKSAWRNARADRRRESLSGAANGRTRRDRRRGCWWPMDQPRRMKWPARW